MIIWKEPYSSEYPEILVQCQMSKEDVIEVQTLLALEEEHEYTSALDALVDFMIVRDAIDTDNEITIGIKLETSLIGH